MLRLVVLAALTCLLAAASASAADQPRLPVPGHPDANGDGRSDLFAVPLLSGPATGWAVFGDRSRKRVHVDRPSFRGFRFGMP